MTEYDPLKEARLARALARCTRKIGDGGDRDDSADDVQTIRLDGNIVAVPHDHTDESEGHIVGPRRNYAREIRRQGPWVRPSNGR